MTDTVLHLAGVTKTYQTGRTFVDVLSAIDLDVAQGAVCALVGPSGSGKTTLLAISAGLERPSSGAVLLCGKDLGRSDEDQLAALRRSSVGFVFQTFQLIPTLTAHENVMVPAELRGDRDARDRAAELLTRVGLRERLDHYPLQLSGGEQQRVALARAFINRPQILFADEPTGNLDGKNAAIVEELLFELNREAGATLILATHNLALAARADRLLQMANGRIDE